MGSPPRSLPDPATSSTCQGARRLRGDICTSYFCTAPNVSFPHFTSDDAAIHKFFPLFLIKGQIWRSDDQGTIEQEDAALAPGIDLNPRCGKVLRRQCSRRRPYWQKARRPAPVF